MTDNLIYRQVSYEDHNPDSRSWYYDNFGNRVDKKTGKMVVLVDKTTEDNDNKQTLLQEEGV